MRRLRDSRRSSSRAKVRARIRIAATAFRSQAEFERASSFVNLFSQLGQHGSDFRELIGSMRRRVSSNSMIFAPKGSSGSISLI